MAKRSKRKNAPGGGIPAKVAVAQGESSWFTRDWLWGLILVGAVILVYLPVWRVGFFWDDVGVIVTNPCIVGPLGLKAIWTTSAADICPLTFTTFWVEHALWGLAPLPYHLVNVFLHAGCAILLWRVLRGLRVPGAWLGAALWALHPVEVESVAWVTETKNTESGLFFLLSILFFVRWLGAGDLGGRTGRDWDYGLTLIFAALAMAAKSSTVVLPIVLGLCAWWVEGRWQWRNLIKVAPIFLMSAAAGVVSIWTQKLHGADDPRWVQIWPERLVTAGDAVWFYLGKLLWPHPLVIVYPRWKIDAGSWFSYLPLVAVLILLFIFWWKRRSWGRPWFFVFGYFLAALLPVLGLVNISFSRDSLVADHFQYLAAMGPLALVGAGIARMADFVHGRSWLPSTLGAGILLVLGLLSWQRARVYQSEVALWADALAWNPNSWAVDDNLGSALLKERRVDEAIIQYQKALEINPGSAEIHDDLGIVLFQKGRVDEAMVLFEKALEIDPDYAQAHNNLGFTLFQKGRVDEAVAHYQMALEIDPDYAFAHSNLGMALVQKGRLDEAITQFQDVLRLNPGDRAAQDNLAKVLAMARQAPGSK
jgi:tetratricopeptide (TPR) repeat protein